MSVFESQIVPNIPDDILERWQDIVNTMARIMRVPTAIIAKIEKPIYEICRVSSPNPHGLEAGRQLSLADVYCETVFRSRKPLLIHNALKAEHWKNHPEVRLGYVSYLGYPIFLPNGEVFGTICVLDTKENAFGENYEKMVTLFKDQIESHIQLLCNEMHLEEVVRQRTSEVREAHSKLVLEVKERKRAHVALKKSEARLRNVLESSLVGISISRNGKLIFQNPEHQRILGTVPDGVGFPYLANVHPEDEDKVRSLYQSFAADKATTFEAEYRFFPFGCSNRALDIKWIHCRAIQLRDDKNPAILASIIDISRMKALETVVRIEDKMSSLGRVAAGIAHELRNPLSAIKMYLQALEDDFSDAVCIGNGRLAAPGAVTSKIRDATDRIEGIIKKVIDFARPSVPQPALVNLNHCIEKVIELSAATIRKSGVDLRLILDANLPPCLVDPLLIENALLNLISNAAEVLEKVQGPRRLVISSLVSEEAVCIRLADSGPGIPENIRERIFDPFFTTKSDGAGIGLSMAHRIISDHGGTLRVSTSRWQGAEFVIHIPLSTMMKAL